MFTINGKEILDKRWFLIYKFNEIFHICRLQTDAILILNPNIGFYFAKSEISQIQSTVSSAR